MTLQEVGEQPQIDATLVSTEWHTGLNINQLAAYIRYRFISQQEKVIDWDSSAHSRPRPHWDGGKSPDGVKHKSIWLKIARAVVSVNANPGVWVAAHFSPALHAVRTAVGKSTISCCPELMASELSCRIYDEYAKSFFDLFSEEFESARVSISSRFNITAALGLPPDDHFYLTICDATHVNARAFLRHAFSAEAGCERGVRRYLVRAALEYELCQPFYELLIKKQPEYSWLVTPPLLEKVVKFRKHWSMYEQ